MPSRRLGDEQLLSCLLFWQDVTEYGATEDRSADRLLRLCHAWAIYNKYLSEDSPHKVGTYLFPSCLGHPRVPLSRYVPPSSLPGLSSRSTSQSVRTSFFPVWAILKKYLSEGSHHKVGTKAYIIPLGGTNTPLRMCLLLPSTSGLSLTSTYQRKARTKSVRTSRTKSLRTHFFHTLTSRTKSLRTHFVHRSTSCSTAHTKSIRTSFPHTSIFQRTTTHTKSVHTFLLHRSTSCRTAHKKSVIPSYSTEVPLVGQPTQSRYLPSYSTELPLVGQPTQSR